MKNFAKVLIPYFLVAGLVSISVATTIAQGYLYSPVQSHFLNTGLVLLAIGFAGILIVRPERAERAARESNDGLNPELFMRVIRNILIILAYSFVAINVLVLFDFFITYVMIAAFFSFSFLVIGLYSTVNKKWDKYERMDEPEPKSGKLMTFFDYRSHPFSLSLFLFTLLNLYYTYKNKEGVENDFIVARTGTGAISLPLAFVALQLPVYYNMMLYIFGHFDFLGFRKRPFPRDVITTICYLEWFIAFVTVVWGIFSIVGYFG